jgi:hypothetical protein
MSYIDDLHELATEANRYVDHCVEMYGDGSIVQSKAAEFLSTYYAKRVVAEIEAHELNRAIDHLIADRANYYADDPWAITSNGAQELSDYWFKNCYEEALEEAVNEVLGTDWALAGCKSNRYPTEVNTEDGTRTARPPFVNGTARHPEAWMIKRWHENGSISYLGMGADTALKDATDAAYADETVTAVSWQPVNFK